MARRLRTADLYLCAFASTKIAAMRNSIYADCGRRGFHNYADLGKRGIASRAFSSTRFCSMISKSLVVKFACFVYC